MKTFASLRESLGRNPSGKKIFDKKMSGVPVVIHKEKSGFVVYIEGDRLDSYKDEKEAMTAAQEFVKQYKG